MRFVDLLILLYSIEEYQKMKEQFKEKCPLPKNFNLIQYLEDYDKDGVCVCQLIQCYKPFPKKYNAYCQRYFSFTPILEFWRINSTIEFDNYEYKINWRNDKKDQLLDLIRNLLIIKIKRNQNNGSERN